MTERERLQTDAANRAKEMYRRSQSYNVNTLPNGYNGNFKDNQRHTQNTQTQNEKQPNAVHSEKKEENIGSEIAEEAAEEIIEDALKESVGVTQNESASLGGDIIESLFQDKEKTLIILLIALLSDEKSNTSLMLALIYLIM